MSPKKIIANIDSLYNHFFVPKKVSEHCRKVHDVALEIIRQIPAVNFNTNILLAGCLVHDLGNIAKIDFKSELAKKLYTPEECNFFVQKKKELAKKYGLSAKEATTNMLKSINCDLRIIKLLDSSDWETIDVTAQSNNLPAKILAYSDYRVGPFGVVSLQQRLTDLKIRYASINKESELSSDNIRRRNNAYFIIEKELVSLGFTPNSLQNI